MKTFVMPPGYHVELVASEPMIQEPIFIDFDANGRLWVIELIGYMQDIAGTNERDPRGRISVLEDVDGDGTMDKKTVFLDHLVQPRALKVLDRGVLVGEPPNLWLARDTNGDLRADTKDRVTASYGQVESNVEHNANSLTWALDNWMHTSEVGIYLRLKKGVFEVQKTLSRGQWGASQDDAGRIFRNSNESVLHVDIVPTPYYARNPNLTRTRGSYESLRGDNNEVMTVWPLRPTLGVNRGYQNGVLREDGSLATYTSASSPTVYRGDRLPSELAGNVFVTEPAGNLVSRIIVTDDGTTLKARKAYDQAEFLTSTDERFRPVYLSNAPDGTLYVVDMYHGIVQHRDYITEYLRDQILSRKLDSPQGHGRIYRIVHDTTKRDGAPALSTASPMQLVETLSHPNGWWRDTTQRLLVEKGSKSGPGLDAATIKALTTAALSAPDPRTRMHALWTLDGVDRIEPDTVLRALTDQSRDVRVAAVRISERWLSGASSSIADAVAQHADDPDWAVRRQAAASLGFLPKGAREGTLARVVERHGDDPITLDASLSGMQGIESAILANVMKAQADSPSLTAAISMLSATIVRSAQEPSVQTLLAQISDLGLPRWQRSALLRGFELSLSVQGGTGRGAAARGGNTEPGSRGGPGGAAAFPRARTGASTRNAAPPALKLSRKPALVAFAGSDDSDLGQRADAVLARLDWPGKAGSAPVTPLTEDEQKRFAAGREVYKTLCAACHQPDGRGRENVAATLVGSDLVLGAPGIPIRIVLNGKEGQVGLMPPLGSALSDDQIAATLTYIRREWGHTASAVDAATVKEVRGATVSRTRPWTADELSRISEPGRSTPR
jgi:mono/diheme cytochrome c family protein